MTNEHEPHVFVCRHNNILIAHSSLLGPPEEGSSLPVKWRDGATRWFMPGFLAMTHLVADVGTVVAIRDKGGVPIEYYIHFPECALMRIL